MMNKSWKFLFVTGLVLLISGLSALIISKTKRNKEIFIEEIRIRLGDEISRCGSEFQPLLEYLSRTDLLETSFLSYPSSYSFFIYSNNRLVFWSDNKIVPQLRAINKEKDVIFYEYAGWKCLIRQWQVTSKAGNIRLMAIIPLIYEPPVSNQYLEITWNTKIIHHSQIAFTPIETEDLTGFYYNKEFVFSYDIGDAYKMSNTALQYAGAGFIFTGMASIFLFLFRILIRKTDEKKYAALPLLLIAWVIIFVVSKLLVSSGFTDEIPWFNSRSYASSWLLSNLSDLILFALFILSFSVLAGRIANRYWFVRSISKLANRLKAFISVISILVLYYVITFHFLIFRDIYDNSLISMNIFNSLEVDFKKIAILIVFIINSISFYLLFHTFFKTWLVASGAKKQWLVISLIVGTAIFLVFENNFPVLFLISVFAGYLVLMFISGIYRYFLQYNYRALLYFLSSVVISSAIGAFAIQNLEIFRTTSDIKKYAQTLIEEDYFAEYLINDAVEKIRSDPFIKNWMTSPFVSKDVISRKIRQVYLGKYLEKYSVQILLFDQEGKSFTDQESNRDYNTYFNRYAASQNSTQFDDVYLVSRFSSDLFFKRYQAYINITRYNMVVGHIILDLRQKRTIQRNVYPELLVDSRIALPSGLLKVSYALYSGNELAYHTGEFNYLSAFDPRVLSNKRIFENGVQIHGVFHVAIPTPSRTTLVVSAGGHTFIEGFSNFSYLFLVLILIYGVLLFVFSLSKISNKTEFGFATRIQLYINFAFILPLILVSVTTLSLLSSTSKSGIQEEYVETGNILSLAIQQKLDNFLMSPSMKEELSESLRTTAALLDTDADLYNLSGGLIASTQPDIYRKGLISRYIKPIAYEQIIRRAVSYYIDEDQVGKLGYSITFIPVKTSDTGRLIGILSLPFFHFKDVLEQQQTEILTNILNIFSLLFISLLVISYLASKKLVIPLKLITEKLNKMSFSGYNEPIDWNSQDELGRLVTEYNSMIVNLEKSREALARNQRELAWREIARHVAHEIKNPLTPMKLTLQQLQRRLAGKANLDLKDVEKVVNSLLHQVEVLKDIASSFSAFAKMPIPEMKNFNIVTLLRNTFDLHKNEGDAEVDLQAEVDHINVTGDVKLMGRIITNIILNGIQASKVRTPVIKGKVNVSGKNVLIEISDNGPGIDEAIRDKIFLPGFSTKDSGSGIGLAIAKHGIEQSGGQIWFETHMGSGTKFFIELPLVEE